MYNFSYIFKILFISLFIFFLLFAMSYSSIQKQQLTSNNLGVKSGIKEALNYGDLRVNGNVTVSDHDLVIAIINNYLENNNIVVDEIEFQIYKSENIITVDILTNKAIFNGNSKVLESFSYEVKHN